MQTQVTAADNQLFEQGGVKLAPFNHQRFIENTGKIAGLAVLASVVMVAYDIFMRFFFNAPTDWSTELSAYLLVFTTFVGAAYTSMTGGHIQLEVLNNILSPRVKRQLDDVSKWLTIIFIAFLCWQAMVQVINSYVTDRRQFSLLLTPTYLPQIPIAVGLFIFLYELLFSSIVNQKGKLQGRRLILAGVSVATGVAMVMATRLGFSSLAVSMVLLSGIAVAMLLVSGLITTLLVSAVTAALGALLIWGQTGTAGGEAFLIGIVMMVLLTIGVPIAISLGLVGLYGIYTLIPGFNPIALAERAWTTTNSFEMTAIPAFLLMGELLLGSGLANDLYQNVGRWIGRMKGGFAHASMLASTIFAAVSGSSVATAATIGAVAAPEMIQRGYSPRLAYGSLAAGGTLGVLIPPSMVMLIYGSMMGVSIGDLFIAGVIPGLLLVVLFMLAITVWSILKPKSTPVGPVYSLQEKIVGLWRILPIAFIIILVLGGLYAGIFTPTEAGVVGCVAAMILCIVTKKLTMELMWKALLSTVRTTSFILLIVVGAACMSYVLDYIQVAETIAASIQELGWKPWVTMLMIFGVYIALGMIMDGVSMMVVTLPVVFPIVIALGYDPIWFGIVMTILIETGLLTPPAGLNLFVMQGVARRVSPDTTLTDIAIGSVPFLIQMFIMLGLLLIFPEIATWLPQQMRS